MALRDPNATLDDDWPLPHRILRSLARRFPRTRRAFDATRAAIAGLGRRVLAIGATAHWTATTARTLLRRRAEPRLTVGIDVTAFWEPLTGVGWYLYRLLEGLAEHPDVRLRLYGPTMIDSPDRAAPRVRLPAGPAIDRVLYDVPTNLALPAGWIIRGLRRLEPLILLLEGNDVVFAPNYFLPRRFTLCGGARVITVHDLGIKRVPWTLRPETRRELETKLADSLRGAERVIAVSGAVADELVAEGTPRDRVRVVRHGPGQLVGVEPGRRPSGLPVPFALHVGTLEPRKNIGTLIEAWRRLSAAHPGAPVLALAGGYGWKTGPIRAAVEAAEREGWARHLGYVDARDLAVLYREAEVVVFPSLYEGFGLPAIEALAAGTPLVCSDLPVLREVAGDAALYAPADDPDRLAEAVARVLAEPDLRSALVERGRARAAGLSWERAADETASVWSEAGGRSTR